MSKIRVQPKDTHWPPDGVRDLPTREPKNAGPLTVRLGDLFAALAKKPGQS